MDAADPDLARLAALYSQAMRAVREHAEAVRQRADALDALAHARARARAARAQVARTRATAARLTSQATSSIRRAHLSLGDASLLAARIGVPTGVIARLAGYHSPPSSSERSLALSLAAHGSPIAASLLGISRQTVWRAVRRAGRARS
jgi:transcriptional regulator of acetoin/glycerol metabolism